MTKKIMVQKQKINKFNVKLRNIWTGKYVQAMDEQYVPVETRIGDEDDYLRNKNLKTVVELPGILRS